jgi:hypothetical protein
VGLPEFVTDAGLKLALAFGIPLTSRFTVPVKPFRALTMIVDVLMVPWTIDRELGEADSEKSGMFNTTVVVWVRVPLVPLMVSV